MPYCSHCRREVPSSEGERCPECGRLLLAQEPSWRPFDPQEPFAVVRIVHNELVAHLLRGQLEMEGIPATIQYEAAGHVLGLTVDGLGEHRVMVPESLMQEAEETLAAFEHGSADASEAQR